MTGVSLTHATTRPGAVPLLGRRRDMASYLSAALIAGDPDAYEGVAAQTELAQGGVSMSAIAPLLEAEPSVLPKWEYVVAPLDTIGFWKKTVDSRIDRLNELGQAGWEAVGVSLGSGDLVAKPVVLLKRPLR
jgi:hypothetical protein